MVKYKDECLWKSVHVAQLSSLFCFSDPSSADLDQLELPVLCDSLRRYLLDLPQSIVPTALYAQMVHTAKGERKALQLCLTDHGFLC